MKKYGNTKSKIKVIQFGVLPVNWNAFDDKAFPPPDMQEHFDFGNGFNFVCSRIISVYFSLEILNYAVICMIKFLFDVMLLFESINFSISGQSLSYGTMTNFEM